MGLSAQTEIAAPPEVVRSVFLDFQQHKEFHHIFTIKSLDPSIQPVNLKPGDKLDVDIKGYPFKFQFQPTIIENSPGTFQWLGSVPLLLGGKHEFYFSQSQETPGGTTLIQKEDFTGLLAFLTGPKWSFGKTSIHNFETLNKDLKTAAEAAANKP
ncbi:uncharacterized protein F4822DRAFT_413813 [Hypoxylon trugodes]|uniref:uncharacterized protein n=1 Tax=Hypoxylon trugodes TaxID=326681 RepID=UPI0021998DD0|nr:uncharacterized protein F4822DRAFT_413813 [Hypoxylon trugodes]KAI1385653.1 hypothetical protein F4822DRAFT_413813 [Hypoxylon trugodes]